MTRRRVLDGSVLAGCGLIAVGIVIDLVTLARADVSSDVLSDLVLVPVVAALALLGPAIVRRRPGNPIGALFSVLVLIAGVIVLADAYAAHVANPSLGSWPYDHIAAWIANFVWVPFLVLLLCELPLRFPDGALPSARWRWAERLVVLQIVVLMLGLAFASGELDNYPIDNPLGIETPGNLFKVLQGIGLFMLIPCVALGAAAMVVRFRRARGLERQQLKWLSLGAACAAVCFALSLPVSGVFGVDAWVVSVPIAIAAVVASAGLAVMRYRLYDVDRLISRTLSWVAISALLGVAYVALVLAGQALFSSFAGGSNLAIAVSTLVVAALFLPLRSRVQRVVDRRFNRRRYDAQRTLDGFAGRLREHVDLEALQGDLRDVVHDTMEPAHVSLWLRSGGRA